MCLCIKNVSLGIVNEQNLIIYYRTFVDVQKKSILASSSFTIWSIMMKLHKNNGSNNSFELAQKFCSWGLSAPAVELCTCIK